MEDKTKKTAKITLSIFVGTVIILIGGLVLGINIHGEYFGAWLFVVMLGLLAAVSGGVTYLWQLNQSVKGS